MHRTSSGRWQSFDFLGTAQPIEVDILGARGIITGGSYEQIKQAVYTRQQEFENVVTPPAATPVVEETVTVEVTLLFGKRDPREVRDELMRAGVELNINLSVTGLR